jgi:hypothetical protein
MERIKYPGPRDAPQESDQFLPVGEVAPNTSRKRANTRPYYLPVELRTSFLMVFSILTLVIFTLLQLAAASQHLQSISGHLVTRSDCPPGSTCAPAPSAFTNFGQSSETSTISAPAPTVPASDPTPSSYTNFNNNDIPTPGEPPHHSFTFFGDWQRSYYFLGTYLATLIAVLYGILWKCIFARIKEMEPFFQMMKPGGATAKDSLLLDYADATLLKIFFSSLTARHGLSLVGAINSGLITVCTALAPDVLYIGTTGTCGPTGNGKLCKPFLAVRSILGWILGVIVFGVFVLAVAIILTLRRRKSGIFAEATSLAGLATLVPEKTDFSHDPYPINDQSWARSPSTTLPDLRFFIGSLDPDSKSPSYARYGIISSTPRSPHETNIPYRAERKPKSNLALHPISLTCLWLVLVGFLVLIIYYRYVSHPSSGNGFESFMDSESFGIRTFMACIGLGIRFHWSAIETYIRKATVYLALANPAGAIAKDSVLVGTRAHAITSLVSRDVVRSPFGGVVSFVALLAEVLIIALSGVPYSRASSYTAHNVSVHLSIGIIAVMILVLTAVFFRTRRAKDVPSRAECLADTMEMISESVLSERLRGMASLSGSERDGVIGKWGSRYILRRRIESEGRKESEWSIDTI